MSVIDDGESTVVVRNLHEFRDWGDVAAHGVDAFGEHECSVGRDALEGGFDGVEVCVWNDDGTRSCQTASVDETGVVVSIGNDGDIRASK